MRLDFHALAVDVFRSDPAVDEPTVVANLIAGMLNSFYDVEVLVAGDLAQYDVTNLQHRGIDRYDSAQLAGLDTSGH